MSAQHTPETDNAPKFYFGDNRPSMETECVSSDFSRKLERQRNELLEALESLLAEYEDRKSQWGDEYLWDKHEHKEVIEAARAAIAKAKGEQL